MLLGDPTPSPLWKAGVEKRGTAGAGFSFSRAAGHRLLLEYGGVESEHETDVSGGLSSLPYRR